MYMYGIFFNYKRTFPTYYPDSASRLQMKAAENNYRACEQDESGCIEKHLSVKSRQLLVGRSFHFCEQSRAQGSIPRERMQLALTPHSHFCVHVLKCAAFDVRKLTGRRDVRITLLRDLRSNAFHQKLFMVL